MSARDWSACLDEHQRTIRELSGAGPVLDEIVTSLLGCFRGGGRVYLIGNGGSAADAQHVSAELLGRFKKNRRALAAIALTTDTSTLSAIGNDLGYEQVFVRQVEALLRPGDVLWAFSTSGNSPNILAAVRRAHREGHTIIGFGGGNGGAMAEYCRHLFCVPHTSSDRIQEGHILAYHYICEQIESQVD